MAVPLPPIKANLDVNADGNTTSCFCCIRKGKVTESESDESEGDQQILKNLVWDPRYKVLYRSLIKTLNIPKDKAYYVKRLTTGIINEDSSNEEQKQKTIRRLKRLNNDCDLIIIEWFRMLGYVVSPINHANSTASFFAEKAKFYFE